MIYSKYESLFELQSIENTISKCNSIYEISLEQWDFFMAADPTLEEFPLSVVHNNFGMLINNFIILRQNRKTKELLYDMYEKKHPILNSGIPIKYIAECFGLTTNSFQQIIYDIEYKLSKKK